MKWKLEVVVVPVADVDRSIAFYRDRAGFDLDHDVNPGNGMRVVQLTPPGSACSIVIGTGLGSMEPGTLSGVQLVVNDIAAARAELLERGVGVSEINNMGAPDQDATKFAFFSDPDGNGWAIQEIRARD